MLDRLEKIQQKYLKISDELTTASNPDDLKKLYKERSRLTPLFEKITEYKKLLQDRKDAEELLKTEKDGDMRSMYEEEKKVATERIESLEKELEILLLPPDPNSGKNILIEIRAGTGGEEAGLFVADLFRMYTKYSDKQGIRHEVIDSSPTGIGGLKEIIFALENERAYDLFKFEAGTHRVQRIPATESGGRIHTSAVTVAVLPEAEESEIDINENDLRIDVYRSSGSGGQHVNTTDSAVRITHIPTGVVVACQDEKSQHKNKAKALRILSARILEKQAEEKKAVADAMKKQMVGSGDRSERIRTYNFPQGRCTDHRIGFTSHNLSAIMEGDLDDLINALTEEDRIKRLASAQNA
ncbi:peptide chain release factor 1 [Leptospira wolffii]|uniref:Peptide chain release factor 1 n=1 Tax=Leptospira wolffii TaxID=409998 RepID=A0A2M9ZF47_9LEPT|nr:peptide chain release factor 1 [Leptospira wolffii]EPG65484.1 peptide chain release factor 1 [Leptospira wolffii serovar Khorat str. Khorat-H2]PJZ67026.1 peptide chain release factor 1 [Leptospira wolffii]TGK62000.1 peptide chain release factor 1 [Leptospira wolffii]TGK68601.1 peptide chain release factor 1 [Leptospira wolffii]TGK74615.1 peptide chain release factor 1 [Leptospira wolffii]